MLSLALALVAQTTPSLPPVPVVTGTGVAYIATSGRTATPRLYDWGRPFREDRAAVGIEQRAQYISPTGQVLLSLAFPEAGNFRQGLAAVGHAAKLGYINPTGEWAIPMNFDVFPGAYDGKAEFREGLALAKRNGQFGYIRPDGTWAIQTRFRNAEPFRNGYARAQTADEQGLIDTDGQFVFTEGEVVGDVSEGLFPVRTEGRIGYADTEGILRIPAKFTQAGTFSDGLAWAVEGGKLGYINPKGEWVIRPTFRPDPVVGGGNFTNGFAWVIRARGEELETVFIARNGKVQFDRVFDFADDFDNGLAYFEVGETMGLISSTGQVVWSAPFAGTAY
ncbi:MAG: WG repeat-containing protein [Fimbriimonadaceae bacterium]